MALDATLCFVCGAWSGVARLMCDSCEALADARVIIDIRVYNVCICFGTNVLHCPHRPALQQPSVWVRLDVTRKLPIALTSAVVN